MKGLKKGESAFAEDLGEHEEELEVGVLSTFSMRWKCEAR